MGEVFEEQVVSALRSAKELKNPTVEVKREGSKLLAWVVSSAFEAQEESDRQALLWEILERSIGFDSMDQIAYVFADAPSEAA